MKVEMQIEQRWWAAQQQRDNEASILSESLMGAEKEVFGRAMAMMEQLLEAVLSGGLINDLATQVRLAVAHHAFNLLCSAWSDAGAARYSAAMHHLRSIDETPDFLAALQVDSSLAGKMSRGKGDVEDAREAISRELERLAPTQAEAWKLERKKRWLHHKFAHVTFPAIAGTLPRVRQVGEERIILKPGGGVVDQSTLRGVAVSLAESAVDVLQAVAFTFQSIQAVKHTWETEGRAFDNECRRILTACGRELGIEVDTTNG